MSDSLKAFRAEVREALECLPAVGNPSKTRASQRYDEMERLKAAQTVAAKLNVNLSQAEIFNGYIKGDQTLSTNAYKEDPYTWAANLGLKFMKRLNLQF
ncbi:hypothetical protein [Neptuniibacter sp. QD37_11]|uniref:hypothetical protein n=1 Tax=Neptuniibacter sp. QD37_11 TaxID=3398209 RepID=UPI0039F45EE0